MCQELAMTPVEAINRINESVTVEMLVHRAKCCSGSHRIFLDSEANYRDPNNFGVVVTEAGRAKLSEAGIDDPAVYFNGKTIRVRGVVTCKEDRPYIEVNEPGQIEIVSR
jgi:collagenase-like PrtC family protease